MDNLIDKLISILEEIETLVRDLIKISNEKMDVLVKSDVKALSAIVEKEHFIKHKMDIAEKKRRETVANLADFLNMDSEIAIHEIIDKVQEPWKSKLYEKSKLLKKLVHEYKETSEICSDLIKSHLGFIDYMINSFSGAEENVTSYGIGGYSKQNVAQKIIDNKV